MSYEINPARETLTMSNYESWKKTFTTYVHGLLSFLKFMDAILSQHPNKKKIVCYENN